MYVDLVMEISGHYYNLPLRFYLACNIVDLTFTTTGVGGGGRGSRDFSPQSKMWELKYASVPIIQGKKTLTRSLWKKCQKTFSNFP